MNTSTKLVLVTAALLSTPAWSKSECRGNWSIDVDRSNTQYKSDLSAYIPVYLQMSSDVQQCRFPVSFVYVNNKQKSHLRAFNHQLNLTVLDRNFHQLNYRQNKGFQLNLERGAVTKFWLKVNQAKMASSGLYNGILELSMRLGDDEQSKKAKVQLDVPAFVAFRSSGNNPMLKSKGHSSYRFSLGNLQSNKTYRADFDLLSNSNVRLVIKQKYGELRLHSEQKIAIPYKLDFNHKPVNTKSTFQFENSGNIKKWGIPMEVSLGNIDFARAGSYRDTITVEVKALP
ncbi:hypothetical protein [Vibrio mytili]|uniref:Uncharacterized protein n=1 Tax=Vibrio mytili TaxID=50718 RepID=A0A0C3DFZ4_9VIBR|nr:hypothetical protein [Vibrio mytili]KIN10289.1 hypothetical protein SU60_14455 [Vibrio mytili]